MRGVWAGASRQRLLRGSPASGSESVFSRNCRGEKGGVISRTPGHGSWILNSAAEKDHGNDVKQQNGSDSFCGECGAVYG